MNFHRASCSDLYLQFTYAIRSYRQQSIKYFKLILFSLFLSVFYFVWGTRGRCSHNLNRYCSLARMRYIQYKAQMKNHTSWAIAQNFADFPPILFAKKISNRTKNRAHRIHQRFNQTNVLWLTCVNVSFVRFFFASHCLSSMNECTSTRE